MITSESFWHFYHVSSFGDKARNTPREFAQMIGWDGEITDAEEMQCKRIAPRIPAGFALLVKDAIYATWCQIASDIERNLGEEITNTLAIGACIDADNLMINCGVGAVISRNGVRKAIGKEEGKLANDAIRQLCREVGYERVLRYLAANIKLR